MNKDDINKNLPLLGAVMLLMMMEKEEEEEIACGLHPFHPVGPFPSNLYQNQDPKPWRLLCVKTQKDQQVLKYSNLPIWHQQPCRGQIWIK